MNATSDPTIPDDLSALLRDASADLAVRPAPLGSVQHRARQRRRRRHGVLACGAVALILLGGLAVAGAVSRDEGDRVVTATAPERPATASGPQPVLAAVAGSGNSLVHGTGAEPDGGQLVEQTSDGPQAWWTTTGRWVPTSGAVLADGRRFGVAQTVTLRNDDLPEEARVDLIDAAGRSVSSNAIEVPSQEDRTTSSVAIVGTAGNDLILERTTRDLPWPDMPSGTALDTTSTLSAYDVDTGEERSLGTSEGEGLVVSASGFVVRATGTDCTLEVSALDGSGARTVPGGCGPGIDGVEGMAFNLAISPDGRSVAVVWTSIRLAGEPAKTFEIIDLETGDLAGSDDPTFTIPNALAWTGTDEVTLAIAPDTEPASTDVGGTEIRTVRWGLEPEG